MIRVWVRVRICDRVRVIVRVIFAVRVQGLIWGLGLDNR